MIVNNHFGEQLSLAILTNRHMMPLSLFWLRRFELTPDIPGYRSESERGFENICYVHSGSVTNHKSRVRRELTTTVGSNSQCLLATDTNRPRQTFGRGACAAAAVLLHGCRI
jgi:hypothetical protein